MLLRHTVKSTIGLDHIYSNNVSASKKSPKIFTENKKRPISRNSSWVKFKPFFKALTKIIALNCSMCLVSVDCQGLPREKHKFH